MSVVSSGSATSPSFEDDYSFLPIDGVPAMQVSSPRGPPSTRWADWRSLSQYAMGFAERLRTFILLPSQFSADIVKLIRFFVGIRCVWCQEHAGQLVKKCGGEFDWICIDCVLISIDGRGHTMKRPTVTPNLKPVACSDCDLAGCMQRLRRNKKLFIVRHPAIINHHSPPSDIRVVSASGSTCTCSGDCTCTRVSTSTWYL